MLEANPPTLLKCEDGKDVARILLGWKLMFEENMLGWKD